MKHIMGDGCFDLAFNMEFGSNLILQQSSGLCLVTLQERKHDNIALFMSLIQLILHKNFYLHISGLRFMVNVNI